MTSQCSIARATSIIGDLLADYLCRDFWLKLSVVRSELASRHEQILVTRAYVIEHGREMIGKAGQRSPDDTWECLRPRMTIPAQMN